MCPSPSPVPSKEPYIVGLQSCNLWCEGTAYCGWDFVYPFGDRKPYLGWYDEGNPEKECDWETKWEVEHGITFGNALLVSREPRCGWKSNKDR